jgi:hypothetical protein
MLSGFKLNLSDSCDQILKIGAPLFATSQHQTFLVYLLHHHKSADFDSPQVERILNRSVKWVCLLLAKLEKIPTTV